MTTSPGGINRDPTHARSLLVCRVSTAVLGDARPARIRLAAAQLVRWMIGHSLTRPVEGCSYLKWEPQKST